MNSILGFVLISALAFIIANIDDLLLLVMFFAQPQYRFRHILAGQALGVTALFAISSTSYFTKQVIPYSWLKFICVIPIFLGIKILVNMYQNWQTSGTWLTPNKDRITVWSTSQVASVAILSIAKGSDNVGIYLPLLAGCNAPRVVIAGLVFLLMMTIWCLLAFYLVKKNTLGRKFITYAQLALPFFLILVGLLVLFKFDLLYSPTQINNGYLLDKNLPFYSI